MDDQNYTPHIIEKSDGTFFLVYGEELCGEYTNLRDAIAKAGDKFRYTAHRKHGYM